jgi:hypothetical protein
MGQAQQPRGGDQLYSRIIKRTPNATQRSSCLDSMPSSVSNAGKAWPFVNSVAVVRTPAAQLGDPQTKPRLSPAGLVVADLTTATGRFNLAHGLVATFAGI